MVWVSVLTAQDTLGCDSFRGGGTWKTMSVFKLQEPGNMSGV